MLDDINKYEYEDISILPLATKYTNLKSFNPTKTDFLNAFKDKFCITNDSYEILNMLINFDKEHNHYIDFTQLLQECNSIFNFQFGQILKNGVNPNLLNNAGIYPLSYAINLNNVFALYLLKSDKIDLKIKLK